MNIIQTRDSLTALCGRLRASEFVTVDTEFMREQTYWPKLCLIQIAGDDDAAIIDPLSDGIDLQPFFDLMADISVLKVFHAARQDVEIIYKQGGVIPRPMFDTQVAAMVCGFGDQAGYEALVRHLARARIDKSSRFTDWSRRPLSAKQLNYALSDVTHLRVIYDKLKRQLDRSRREPWLEEEMAILTCEATYENDPELAYRRIRFRARKAREVAVLKAVAAWREREAQARDVPRNRVLKDDALIEIAVQAPGSAEELRHLRALPRGLADSRIGEQITKAVQAALRLDPADMPRIVQTEATLADGAGGKADILKLALKVISEREGIAPKLIASSADIERMASGDYADVAALQGWRRQVFGDVALDLVAGRLAIGIRDGVPDIFAVAPAHDAPIIRAAE